MFYNPDFVHRLSERELEGVEAHEVLHCCFQHFTRLQHRDIKLWNIAGDFVINDDLISSGFTLPGKPLPFAAFNNPQYKGITGHLLDPQFKGMNTEEVYEYIERNIPKVTIQISSGSGDGKDGEGQDPGGCGGVMEAPGNGASQDDVKHTWEASVRAAVAVARHNNAGNIPGSLQRLVEQLQRPKVSWRDLTRNFIDQSMTKDVSWSRISRRSASIGVLMPGLISDRMHHLIMIVDISGSINEKMMTEFVSEVAGALDQGTADMISVVYADTEVRHVDEFVQGDVVKVKTFDGGGTDFRDSFKWVTNNAPDASCVIYLTDLCVNEFGEDPGCPCLWAVYGPHQQYEHYAPNVPFGTCLHISNSVG
jgi:predicted metal-dependent peptidase